jgi:hypothetical protein
VCTFIAAVNCAAHTIITGICAGTTATVPRITDLGAIAPEPVVTDSVIRSVVTGVCILIATVHRARDSITAVLSRPGQATLLRIAGLGAIAPEPVIAVGV